MPYRWFHKRSSQDFQAEIESHLALEADRLRGEGAKAEPARAAAARAFGNVGRAEERYYDATHWTWGGDLARDVALSWRTLRKSPSFALAAVLTLAVAIGANLVAFGALNAVLLRPVNVPDAASLYTPQPRLHDTSLGFSYPDYVDLRDRNRSFTSLAAFSIADAVLGSGNSPDKTWMYEVSSNYFDALELHPYLGHFFHIGDEHGDGSIPEVVLSYDYWRRHFQSDAGVVGRTVELNQHPFTVAGIAPPSFHGTILFFSPALFVPMVEQPAIDGVNKLHSRATGWVFMTLGHLRPGVTATAAAADLNAVGATLARAYPKDDAPFSFSLKRPGLYGDFLGRPARAFTTALMLLALLILVAACANLGSLFAARASDRSRELAVRLALGARRARVLRLLLLEALLVALGGGALGLGASVPLLQRLSAWQPVAQLPIHLPFTPDARVAAAALVLALAGGLLAGAATVGPVLRADPYQTIKAGADLAPRRFGMREALLGVQVAICAILLTASLVAVRGLEHSLTANFGFAPQGAMVVDTDLAGYAATAIPALHKQQLAVAELVPGVRSAGLADWLPLTMVGWNSEDVYRGSAVDLRPSAAVSATVFRVSPGYIGAAETPLLAGRDLAWTDTAQAPAVALVNQEFGRELFGSPTAALGGYFKLQDGARVQVAGVVADGKYNSLTEDAQPAMFLPLAQSQSAAETFLVVRSGANPRGLATALRQQLRRLDPALPAQIEPWTEAMSGNLLPARAAAVALGILGGLSALLVLIGIAGLTAYTVSRRQRELSIRVALGAGRREVLEVAVGGALRLFGAAAVLGLALGVLVSRVLGAIVYAATPRDPVVLAGVVAGLVVIGAAAAWMPARRALATDPAAILRES